MAETNVLITIDLSENRMTTLNFGLYGARRWGWKIHLLEVFLSDHDTEQAMQNLIANIHQENPDIEVDGESIQGDIVEVILEKSAIPSCKLVLLERNETQEWGYLLMGRHSADFVDRCLIDVLTLPADYQIHDFRRMGVLTGFQETEIDAFQSLIDLFDNSLESVIFHVFREKEEEKDRQLQLQDWEIKVRGNVDLGPAKFLLEYNKDIITATRNIIEKEQLDLLVVNSFYRSFFQKLFAKDYFQELINHPPTNPTLYIKLD